jgi:hypothetical protein
MPNIRTGTLYPPLFDVFLFYVANINHKAICKNSFNCSCGSVRITCVPFAVLATFCGVKYWPKAAKHVEWAEKNIPFQYHNEQN